MSLILPRRTFLEGILGLVAAPAIVRIDSLMRVAPIPSDRLDLIGELERRLGALRQSRSLWITHWNETARFFMPDYSQGVPLPGWITHA